ncbi:MAG: Fic/DOC family protein [Candidatus Fimivivens sp.]
MKCDPYLYPGTEVLINKGNHHSQEALDSMEADYVSARIKALMLNPLPGEYDFLHLCKIHHWIFQDIYEWAGKTRSINIEKSEYVLGGLSVEYSDFKNIQKDAENAIESLNSIEWQQLNDEAKANEFSKHMAQLWRIHGFREGNTRTVVTFCCLFAESRSIPLEPSLFEKYSGYVRNALVAASAIFKDLGDRSDLSYLKKIVMDSMIQGREKERPKSIKEKLVAAKVEADRLNAERAANRSIPEPNRYDRGR